MRSTSLSPYLHSEQVGILNKNKYILNIKHDTYLKTQGLILINLPVYISLVHLVYIL